MRAREFILEADEPVNRGRRGFLRAIGSGVTQSILPNDLIKSLINLGVDGTTVNSFLSLLNLAISKGNQWWVDKDQKLPPVDFNNLPPNYDKKIASMLLQSGKTGQSLFYLLPGLRGDQSNQDGYMKYSTTPNGVKVLIVIGGKYSVSSVFFYNQKGEQSYINFGHSTDVQQNIKNNDWISNNIPQENLILLNALIQNSYKVEYALEDNGSDEAEQVCKDLVDISIFGQKALTNEIYLEDIYTYWVNGGGDEKEIAPFGPATFLKAIKKKLDKIILNSLKGVSISDKNDEIVENIVEEFEESIGHEVHEKDIEYINLQIEKYKNYLSKTNFLDISGTQSSGIKSSIEKFLEPIIRSKVYSQIIDKTMSSVKANQVSQQTPQDNKPLALPDYTKITNDIISQAQSKLGRKLNDTEIEYIKSEVEKAKK